MESTFFSLPLRHLTDNNLSFSLLLTKIKNKKQIEKKNIKVMQGQLSERVSIELHEIVNIELVTTENTKHH